MAGLTQIKQTVRKLSPRELRKLDEWLRELVTESQEDESERRRSGRQIVEERTLENKTYRLEGVRCGKGKCKCARGKLHGPYWYSYVRVKGRVKSQYVGKKLPREVEKELRGRKNL
jgi:hypothetical protein